MTTDTGRPTKPAALHLTRPYNWRDDAACREVDPETFFPIAHTQGWRTQTRQAKQICAGCPVIEECLRWALDSGQTSGVWGGLSEGERFTLRRAAVPTIVFPQGGGRKRGESRYWPGFPNAVEGIIGTRRREVEALVKRGARVGEIALALKTNAQTVKKVLKALERVEATEGAGAA